MKTSDKKLKGNAARIALFSLVLAALIVGMAQWSSVNVSANHPVLVEGNCDSPVPGTTIVAAGTCGDFDGDTRIGTAEDTDGADRIFGTLTAALGPGTGAAAGTGANHNGKIIIVTSGRFAESLYIGQNFVPGGPGVVAPANVTIEAAPGVHANIDAVLQGDPAGGNSTRQNGTGIQIVYTNPFRTVTLRNLEVRNFAVGIGIGRDTRVNIDDCRIENNIRWNIQLIDDARTVITDSQSQGAGLRIGGPTGSPNPGDGILVQDRAQLRVMNSTFSNNYNCGINNATGVQANVQLFKVSAFFNGSTGTGNTDICGPVTISPNPNFATTN